MCVNIITESLIQKIIVTAHPLFARCFPEQGGLCPKELVCTSFIHLKTPVFFFSNIKSHSAQQRNKIGLMGSSLFSILDCP